MSTYIQPRGQNSWRVTISAGYKNSKQQRIYRSGKKLAPRTVANYLTELSCIFTTAIRWEMILSNPCSRIAKPKADDPEVNILDESESALLIKMLEQESLTYYWLRELIWKLSVKDWDTPRHQLQQTSTAIRCNPKIPSLPH